MAQKTSRRVDSRLEMRRWPRLVETLGPRVLASFGFEQLCVDASPVRLTIRPRCASIAGSIGSLRGARNRAGAPSSSAPASRL